MTLANAANGQAGLPEREVLLHWRTLGVIANVCAAGCAVVLLTGVIVVVSLAHGRLVTPGLDQIAAAFGLAFTVAGVVTFRRFRRIRRIDRAYWTEFRKRVPVAGHDDQDDTATREDATMPAPRCEHTYDPDSGACADCGVAMIAVPETFDGLLDVAERILTAHYPSDIFPTPTGDTRDPGVQLVTAVRAVVDARRQ